jgi:hypothetical protein
LVRSGWRVICDVVSRLAPAEIGDGLMNEQELRGLIAEVAEGTMSRRSFVRKMVALGLTAPMAGTMLAHSGVAWANATLPYKPTQAGGGGLLKMLLWQAPTLLNPHFASGTKDQIASRIFFEPLAGWDKEGNLIPQLAAEVPTKENGGVSADGTQVTWKLKRNVKWHDGKAVHGRRRRFHGGVCRRPGHGRLHHGLLYQPESREGRRSHGADHVPQSDAVLGGPVRGRHRPDPAEAPFRRLQGREVPRGAREPEADRDRSLQVRGLQAR